MTALTGDVEADGRFAGGAVADILVRGVALAHLIFQQRTTDIHCTRVVSAATLLFVHAVAPRLRRRAAPRAAPLLPWLLASLP